MKWTKTPPAEFGYYWWKIIPDVSPEVILVFEDGTFFKAGDDHEYTLDHEGGEWFGPLEAPV